MKYAVEIDGEAAPRDFFATIREAQDFARRIASEYETRARVFEDDTKKLIMEYDRRPLNHRY